MVVEPAICLGAPSLDAYLAVAPNFISRAVGPHCSKMGKQAGLTRVAHASGDRIVFATCEHNGHRALLDRHLAQPKYALARPIEVNQRFGSDLSRAYLARLGGHRRQWRERWSVGKLQLIDRARQLEYDRPNRVKLSVKREPAARDSVRPRGIQAYSSLATQARFGPEHSVFQKALFATLRDYELCPGVRVSGTSGWQVRDFVDWADSIPDGWVFTECDMSAFDSTVTAPWRQLVVAYMRLCDSDLADHVEAGIDCTGSISCDPGTRYRVHGTTKSGHNDTTSGNTIVNATATAASLWRIGIEARVLVIGDDMLAAHPPCEAACERLVSELRAHGFTPKAATFSDVNHVTYAGGVFTRTSGSTLYHQRLGKLVQSLFLSVNPPSARHRARYLHGVATGFLSTYAGHPFYEAFLRPHVIDGEEWLPGRAHVPGGPCGLSAAQLAEHFDVYASVRGYSADSLLAELRDFMRRDRLEPCDMPRWDRCALFDTCDATERTNLL